MHQEIVHIVFVCVLLCFMVFHSLQSIYLLKGLLERPRVVPGVLGGPGGDLQARQRSSREVVRGSGEILGRPRGAHVPRRP